MKKAALRQFSGPGGDLTGMDRNAADRRPDPEGPSPRVAAAAIRDAVAALRAERPDLAAKLEELAAALERSSTEET